MNKSEYFKKWRKNNLVKHREQCKKAVKIRHDRRRSLIQMYKKLIGCSLCGERDPICLEFHHKNAKRKEKGVSQVLKFRTEEDILKEIRKCVILCSNCHRKVHQNLKVKKK